SGGLDPIQCASNSRSNTDQASRGTLSAMRRLARTSRGSSRSTSKSALPASISSASRTRTPSRRSVPANRASVAGSMRSVRGVAREEIVDDLQPRVREVGFTFQEAPQRGAHDVGVETVATEAQERPGPVDGLRHARSLGKLACAQPLNEPGDRAREMLVEVRNLAPEDANLLVLVRVLDEKIQAAPAQRVADLARPVRGQHHVRNMPGLDRPQLGDRHLEVRKHFEQEG